MDHYCTAHHIQWTHTPARSPQFGGLWEATVKSMKQLFTKLLGPHNLFMDDLYFLTVEIEAVLNLLTRRWYRGTHTRALLNRAALKSIPVMNHSNRKFICLTRWNLCQRLAADLWDWWSKEYITHLQVFTKYRYPKCFAVNDIVLLRDTDLFIRTWPLVRVVEVHSGKDGLVRVATIKTVRGIYRRAIHKLVPLVEDDYSFPAPGCSGLDPPQEESSSQRMPSGKEPTGDS